MDELTSDSMSMAAGERETERQRLVENGKLSMEIIIHSQALTPISKADMNLDKAQVRSCMWLEE